MQFREATINDIPELHAIRISVKENPLNNPLLVTEKDYHSFLTSHGKGWLCEADGVIAGFAIVDKSAQNIWALFIKPGHEKKGIGRKLQEIMLDWYFKQSKETLWLGTAPNTRAEGFYRTSGWREVGKTSNGEIRFEMTFSDWMKNKGR